MKLYIAVTDNQWFRFHAEHKPDEVNFWRPGGVIVPDGVLFRTSNAHIATRKILLDKCNLEGVISKPSGVFKPYAGVSTAVLVFQKGGTTDNVRFCDMEADGFSLDDKRQKITQNDIPDITTQWNKRVGAQHVAPLQGPLRKAAEPSVDYNTVNASVNVFSCLPPTSAPTSTISLSRDTRGRGEVTSAIKKGDETSPLQEFGGG